MSNFPQLGDVVTVKVKRVLPFGLRVILEDGQPGLIRDRELTWSTSVEHDRLREQYTVGDVLQAVVLGENRQKQIELSLRLVQNDPWTDLPQRYHLGQLVSGVVTGIQPYGVFLELEPGVVGLLHNSRLPAWPGVNQTDLFWPGDHVTAAIDEIDVAQRRLNFSLAKAVSRRWESAAAVAAAPVKLAAADRPKPFAAAAAQLPLQLWLHAQPQSILVIEDDAIQRSAVADWLRNAGQYVRSAVSAEEALLLLQDYTPNIVLIDVGLPGQNGIQAVQHIRERWPDIRHVLMTDWARAEEHSAELKMLRATGVGLLIKPFLPDELLSVLVPRNGTPPAESSAKPMAPLSAAPAEALTISSATRQSLRNLLEEVRKTCGATKVVLFALDPAHQRVTIAAESGPVKLKELALLRVIYTPVRDVAEGELLIHIEDAQTVEGRVRYLRPLLEFQACLGVSVPSESSRHYALFLFHPRPHAFEATHEQLARVYATAIGAVLDSQELRGRITEMQRLAILGNLTRALVHELNHQLSPISFSIEDLQARWAHLEQHVVKHPDPQLAADELQQAYGTLKVLARRIHSLMSTASLFREVTVHSHEQILRLDTAVEEVASLIKEHAEQARVQIAVQPVQGLLFTRAQAAQVQQILLNLMLNAVQQIALVRPNSGGRVLIKLGQTSHAKQTRLQISVEDDGPGIHWRLWERIFEPGFTTREEEGSGLGLYISRSLVETMGGRIYVANSHILWGSTFIIELPFRT